MMSDLWENWRSTCQCVNRELRRLGWKVVRVWECELREPRKVAVKVRGVWETYSQISIIDQACRFAPLPNGRGHFAVFFSILMKCWVYKDNLDVRMVLSLSPLGDAYPSGSEW